MSLQLFLQIAILLVVSVPLLFIVRRCTSPIRHVGGPPSVSWWRGNLGQVYSRDGWAFHRHIVERYGGAVKLNALFGSQQLYVSDPKALYHILVKDASIYEETTWYLEGNMLVFGPGLLSTKGDHHRKQRRMLNPVFSMKHMRNLTPLFRSVSDKLRNAIALQTKDGPREVDLLNWMSRAALELIGQGGLGTFIDPLDGDPRSITAYGQSIKNLIPTAFRLSMFRFFIPLLVKLGPPGLRRFLLDMAPSVLLQKVKGIVDVMAQTSTDIFREKLAALEQGDEAVMRQVGEGKDVMSILLKANVSAASDERLPDDELLAQMSTFMFAGHDTTSSALSRALHCLVSYPEVQQKLRDEIDASGILKGEVTYEELIGLPYLDAIVRETLRLRTTADAILASHPPINFMSRTAVKDAVLPFSVPVISVDGATVIHEVPIRKGQDLIVGFGAVNKLKTVWGEDAYEWKPERWLEPLPMSVTDAHIAGVYSSLMTFSAGPRACIGFKFAELELKMVLATLISSFRFENPEGKEIIWNLGGIQTPAVRGAEIQTPHMPLKVTLLDNQT